MLISQTTCEEMSAANVSCALCLIGATEIEAMNDFGFDEELMIGFLIQERILRNKLMLHRFDSFQLVLTSFDCFHFRNVVIYLMSLYQKWVPFFLMPVSTFLIIL